MLKQAVVLFLLFSAIGEQYLLQHGCETHFGS